MEVIRGQGGVCGQEVRGEAERREEREQLEALIHAGKSSAQTLTRARILLKADVSEAGEGWSDSAISTAVDTSVAHTRQLLVEEGFEATLKRKYNPNSGRPRIFGGAAEAKLIALACSPAPQGFARWTLRLPRRGSRRIEHRREGLSRRRGVGIGRHHMCRPEPGRQRQFRPMHRRAGGERGLATAVEDFEKARAAVQSHGAPLAARRTNKPVRPAPSVKKRRATRLVGKLLLKLLERSPPRHQPCFPTTARPQARHHSVTTSSIA
jgi:hypothetical protein